MIAQRFLVWTRMNTDFVVSAQSNDCQDIDYNEPVVICEYPR